MKFRVEIPVSADVIVEAADEQSAVEAAAHVVGELAQATTRFSLAYGDATVSEVRIATYDCGDIMPEIFPLAA